jgi:uncharacterized pyridoxamine 5'-phosphate oxidase family protein
MNIFDLLFEYSNKLPILAQNSKKIQKIQKKNPIG